MVKNIKSCLQICKIAKNITQSLAVLPLQICNKILYNCIQVKKKNKFKKLRFIISWQIYWTVLCSSV